MTVAELRKELNAFPDDHLVWVIRDVDDDDYSRIANLSDDGTGRAVVIDLAPFPPKSST
jgi:hypothetical protein